MSNQTAGMIYEQRSDGIHVFRFNDNRRETIDAWIEQNIALEEEANRAKLPVSFLIDLRGHLITPYAIARVIQNLHRTPPDLTEWVAVVAGGSLLLRSVELIIRRFPASVQPSTRAFPTEDTALNWLHRQRSDFEAGGKTQA